MSRGPPGKEVWDAKSWDKVSVWKSEGAEPIDTTQGAFNDLCASQRLRCSA